MNGAVKTAFGLVTFACVTTTFIACGSTKLVADAGVEPVDATVGDVVVREAAAPPGCADASIDDLMVPSVTLDGGQSSTACFTCLKGSCRPELDACNDNCECRSAVVDFLSCSAKTTSAQGAQTCAFSAFGSVSGEASQLGTGVGRCAFASCQAQCIPSGFLDAGSDARAEMDASDAESDSGSDAGM